MVMKTQEPTLAHNVCSYWDLQFLISSLMQDSRIMRWLVCILYCKSSLIIVNNHPSVNHPLKSIIRIPGIIQLSLVQRHGLWWRCQARQSARVPAFLCGAPFLCRCHTAARGSRVRCRCLIWHKELFNLLAAIYH